MVLGNLFRDQLDRYGELEAIGERWSGVTSQLGADRVLVRNVDDPLIASLDPGRARVIGFGIDDAGAGLVSMEHASDSKWCARCGARLEYRTVFLGHLGDWRCPNCDTQRPQPDVAASAVQIDGLEACRFDLVTPLGTAPVRLPVPGLYNVYNAVAAAAAACATGVVSLERIVEGLEQFDPAFGRFEHLQIGEREAVLVLIKNPAGANEVVRTLIRDGEPKRMLLALNDRIADGRDVSWIWDVDYELFDGGIDHAVATGTRAAEMALRLKYAGQPAGRVEVVPDLEAALDTVLAGDDGRTVYMLATYTAMLDLRHTLTAPGRRAALLGGDMTDLVIGHLYPDYLNIYADRGNIAVFRQRCAWRGIGFEVRECEPGDALPAGRPLLPGRRAGSRPDAGGRGSAGEGRRSARGRRRRRVGAGGVRRLPAAGAPLPRPPRRRHAGYRARRPRDRGRRRSHDRERHARVRPGRGVTQTLVGFENHAGRTHLGPGLKPLGRVVRGRGNNGEDGQEGVRDGRVIGTYVHGPLLPKNPWLADLIIAEALERRHGTVALEPLEDGLELEAQRVAAARP